MLFFHKIIMIKGVIHMNKTIFTGHTKFDGEINGKKGSVVLVENGEHSNRLLSNFTIKPSTATGRLVNLKGNAQYTFENGQVVLLTDF